MCELCPLLILLIAVSASQLLHTHLTSWFRSWFFSNIFASVEQHSTSDFTHAYTAAVAVQPMTIDNTSYKLVQNSAGVLLSVEIMKPVFMYAFKFCNIFICSSRRLLVGCTADALRICRHPWQHYSLWRSS